MEAVVCHTSFDTIELKITLAPKFLHKSLRDALLNPFLKAYNKKRPEAPVRWEDVKCIKVDGQTVLDATSAPASAIFAALPRPEAPDVWPPPDAPPTWPPPPRPGLRALLPGQLSTQK